MVLRTGLGGDGIRSLTFVRDDILGASALKTQKPLSLWNSGPSFVSGHADKMFCRCVRTYPYVCGVYARRTFRMKTDTA